jgi:hypothetical protein
MMRTLVATLAACAGTALFALTPADAAPLPAIPRADLTTTGAAELVHYRYRGYRHGYYYRPYAYHRPYYRPHYSGFSFYVGPRYRHW